jgi:hypothetical protein
VTKAFVILASILLVILPIVILAAVAGVELDKRFNSEESGPTPVPPSTATSFRSPFSG